ncbi:hypothetical protein ABB37_03485 [Leptomonas pyrrhocoris]|uniref:Uncharacterized protein n=1 Tax=Leptomonas pyrrhocoris TaxID=157538 RepID=A0A0M9G4S2_LEPPY|nr:hypothetical protein ABB37_03485 [Leptomonas pyrrhocoris]KPA82410.1 hypothetical protein ABB37_03485 [Leptomonas pyrrhocoris]|eukprot:XP_015660849.1 hypothetical protein ABB37_03485 [Leptomonas pyrrhocoris]
MEDEARTRATTTPAAIPHFLGSVSISLEHLPPWYQLLSLCGVFAVVHLRNNAVITWLVVQLHSSTGTEAIWVDEYKMTLRVMSFTERLCFSLYGVTLAAIVAVLFRVFCQDTYNIGLNVGQLFPDKRLPTAVVLVLMCVVDGIRLHTVIIDILNSPDSLAHLALHNFVGLEATDFDPSVAESNPHFVIQFELARSFIFSAALRRLPVMLLAAAYRLSRDVPRKAHVALRWYMATFAVFFLLQEILSMYLRYVWSDWSAWAMVGWAVVFLGVVNYTYGPSKRAGTVVTISAANCVTEAVRSLLTCAALWFIVSLVVLAFVVSVHEELVLIWLFITLLILWTPAIIDSCAMDYMTFLSFGAAAVRHAMDSTSTVPSSVRFGVLVFLWWLSTSLLYNATIHIACSRYVAAAVALCWFLWSLAPPRELWENPQSTAQLGLEDGHSVVHLFTARILWLRAVANFHSLPAGSWMYHRSDGDSQKAFDLLLHEVVAVCVVCVAITSAVHYSLSPAVRLRWQQHDIVSTTPSVLLRKAIRTLVVVFCVGASVAAWWMVRLYVLPMWTQLLPDIIGKGLCTVAAVTTLGNLMDMQDSMYDGCVRVLGLRNPKMAAEGGGSLVSDEPTTTPTPRTPRSRVRDPSTSFP